MGFIEIHYDGFIPDSTVTLFLPIDPTMTTRIMGVVLGLLAALTALVGLAWLTLPAMVPALVAWQLDGSGWQLNDLVAERPVNSSLIISQAKLSDNNNIYHLSVENLTLNTRGMDLDNLALIIERMVISMTPSETTETPGTIDLPALLNTYTSSLPLPVRRGKIRQLLICITTMKCREGSLEWSSSDAGTQLSLQSEDLHLDMDLDDQVVRVSLEGNQSIPLEGNLEVRWPGNTNLAIQGQFTFNTEKGRLMLVPDLSDHLQSTTGTVALGFEVNLPLLNYASGVAMARQLSGELLLNSTGTLSWLDQTLRLETNDPLSLNIHLQPGIARLTTGQDLHVEAIIAETGSASVSIPEGLACTVNASNYNMDCMVSKLSILSHVNSPQLTAAIHISNATFKALTQTAPEPGIPSTYRLTGQLDLAMDGFMPVGNEDFKLALSKPLSMTVDLQADLLQLGVIGDFIIQGSLGEMASGLVTATGSSTCNLNLASSSSQCSLDKLSLAATLPEKQLAATIELDNTTLSGSTDGNLQVSTELAFHMTESGNERAAMTGKLTLAANELNLTSSDLALDQFLFEQFDAHHDLASQSGGLTLNYKSQAGVLEPLIGFPVGGQLTLAQQLEWQGPFDSDWTRWQVKNLTTVGARGLSADLDGNSFESGQFDASFSGWPELKTIAPAHLTWKTIDVGFPMRHSTMDFNMEIDPVAETLQVQGLFASTELLGGKVTSNSFSYDYPSDQGLFLARLELLDLKQILSLIDQELNSSGLLIGTIPITYDKGQISVSNGHVESIAPGGFIRYKANEPTVNLASDNPKMTLVMTMLQDFHYEILKSDVEYSNKSILKLKTTLNGRNPAIEGGRQINFNLNIEEDVAALLESLRLSREVSDSIDKNLTGSKQHKKTPQSISREPNDG